MKRLKPSERLKKLEERVQELEALLSLARVKCLTCGEVMIVMPTTKYLGCNCGELFGSAADAMGSIGQSSIEAPGLEWIDIAGYENQLLMSHLRSEIGQKYPRVLPSTRKSSPR
jgi:hypothetical protein